MKRSETLNFLGRHRAPGKRGTVARQNATHTSLLGGLYVLPNDPASSSKLCVAMATDMLNGVPYHICEFGGCRYKLYFDLDLYAPDLLTEADIATLVGVMTRNCKKFYPDDESHSCKFAAMACTAPPPVLCASRDELRALMDDPERLEPLLQPPWQEHARTVVAVSTAVDENEVWVYGTDSTVFELEDGRWFCNIERDKSGRIKQGIHIIYPDLIVADALPDAAKGEKPALYMRQTIVNELTREPPPLSTAIPREEWSNIVDAAVYTTSGLRCYGSHKASNCISCKNGESKRSCGTCNGAGRLDAGRPYTLHSWYDSDGVCRPDIKEKYSNRPAAIIAKASIRTTDTKPTPGWQRPSNCSTLMPPSKRKGTVGKDMVPKKMLKADSESYEITDQTLLDILQTEIRGYIRKGENHYKNIIVTSAQRKGPSIVIYVGGEGENWCINKIDPEYKPDPQKKWQKMQVGANHKSNRIYFVLLKTNQLYQRCFCKCTGKEVEKFRRDGPCKDYSSPPRAISKQNLDLLFPK